MTRVVVSLRLRDRDAAAADRQPRALHGQVFGPAARAGFRVMGGTGNLVRDIFVNPYLANAPMLHALMNDQVVMWCYEVLAVEARRR
jgi:hypothetical protein